MPAVSWKDSLMFPERQPNRSLVPLVHQGQTVTLPSLRQTFV